MNLLKKYAPQLPLLLLAVLIFVAPGNAFLKLCDDCTQYSRVLNDYLIPKLYLSDVVGIAFIVTFFATQLHFLQSLFNINNKQKALIFVVLGLITAQISLNHDVAIVEEWLRLLLFVVVVGSASWYQQNKKSSFEKITIIAVSTSSLFQSLIAFSQFHFQRSVGGYWLLGESHLTNPFGIARTIVSGKELILPYGTTAHPNILAGFLTACVLFLVIVLCSGSIKKSHATTMEFIIAISLYAILLTQSISAWLTLIGIGIVLLLIQVVAVLAPRLPQLLKQSWQPTLVGLLILGWASAAYLTLRIGETQLSDTSWYRRSYLLETSIEMSQQYPWFGVGLGNFTKIAPSITEFKEIVRFNQPVHHVAMLWLAETGVVGLMVLVSTFTQLRKNNKTAALLTILFIFPLLVWDHYLLSLPSGQFVVLLVLISSFKKIS